jgi:hypothetical protein
MGGGGGLGMGHHLEGKEGGWQCGGDNGQPVAGGVWARWRWAAVGRPRGA